nr:hypothetical protein [uncultured Janthinobacterium sp.]
MLKIGIGIQHALELANHINVELVDDLLLCGRFGWRRVCDDGGHFLWRTAPAEVLEEFDCSHGHLEVGA